MFGGGLLGLLSGLGAFSFNGFHLFGLPSHEVSVAFRACALFRTFVEAAVVVSRICISKLQTTPYYAGW